MKTTTSNLGIEIIEQFTPFTTPIFTLQYGDQKLKSHKKLNDKALSLEKEDNGRQISNRGGFQSNEFTMEDTLTHDFFHEILPVIQQYTSIFELAYNHDTSLDNLWFNVNRKNHFNYPHTHGGSTYSGIYYLSVPEDSGNLIFNNPDSMIKNLTFYGEPMKTYNEFNSTQFNIIPKEKLLVLFPSHIEHYVEPNNGDKPRISIAFNINITKEKVE